MGRALQEETLREHCRRVAGVLPGQPAIRSIAFVGALELNFGGEDLDSVRLTHALDYLLRSDVAVAPDFEVDIVNLFHGRDFLAEDRSADLVFVSFVPDVDHRLFQKVAPEILDRQRDPAAADRLDRSFFWQARSSRHEADRWRERVEASGARWVLCVGGRREVGTRVLEGEGLRTVIPTPDADCQAPHRRRTRKELYGVDWDVPYKWLSALARPDVFRTRPDPARRPPRTRLAEALLGGVPSPEPSAGVEAGG